MGIFTSRYDPAPTFTWTAFVSCGDLKKNKTKKNPQVLFLDPQCQPVYFMHLAIIIHTPGLKINSMITEKLLME